MRVAFALSLVLAAIMFSPRDAAAAPQALALLASNGAMPLTCAGGTCQAELSAYCLQQERAVPLPGTKYRVVDPRRLTLVIASADGSVRRLPASDHAEIASARMYTAVAISISEQRLASLGAVFAAVEVGDGATLVPVPLAGDPFPHTASDIETASGPIRAAGTRIVDRGGEAADAARVIGRLINALPPPERTTATQGDARWRDAVEPNTRGIGDAGVARAENMYRACRGPAEHGSAVSLRGCLETRHDALMQELNADFWTALKLGS